MKLNYNKLRQPIWRNGSLTWENFAVLAIALLACNMAQAATSAHRMAAVTTGTTSGFPVIAEGIISWVKTLAGAGCGWGVYDKVGGGRDIQSTLKDGALPMAGLGMVAAPSIVTDMFGVGASTSGPSIAKLLAAWNFSFS